MKGLHYRVVYQWRAGLPSHAMGAPCTRKESERFIAIAKTANYTRPAYRLRICPRFPTASPDIAPSKESRA